MQEDKKTKPAVLWLAARFPDRAAHIWRTALGDQSVCDMCEDLAIALETLSRFEARADADACPEISEYKLLIVELEEEITAHLDRRFSI